MHLTHISPRAASFARPPRHQRGVAAARGAAGAARLLDARGYEFVTATPATHGRVLARDGRAVGRRPARPARLEPAGARAALPDGIVAALLQGGVLERRADGAGRRAGPRLRRRYGDAVPAFRLSHDRPRLGVPGPRQLPFRRPDRHAHGRPAAERAHPRLRRGGRGGRHHRRAPAWARGADAGRHQSQGAVPRLDQRRVHAQLDHRTAQATRPARSTAPST